MYYIFYNRVKWTSLSKKEKKYDWERTNQLKYIILLKIAIEGCPCPKKENLLQGENELVVEIYFTLNGGSNGASLSKKGKFIIGKERTSIKLIISGVAAIEATKAVASVKTSTTKIRRFIFLFFFNPEWSVLWKNQICIVI